MRCGLRTELAMPHEILALGLRSERLRCLAALALLALVDETWGEPSTRAWR